MLRDFLKQFLKEWPMSDNLDPVKFEINRLISQLDDVAIGYEAKWGIGQLEAWAYADNPELADKFQRQLDKLGDKIHTNDVVGVRDLVDGFVRAYKALEDSAVKFGKEPKDPVIFFYKCGSLIYKITRTVAESRSVSSEDGCVVMSCVELVNYYNKNAMGIYLKRDNSSTVLSTVDDQNFDWIIGDEIPPEF